MDLEGICPCCKEWTTAGESCCGFGATVEGHTISDEEADEILEERSYGKFGKEIGEHIVAEVYKK